MQFKEIRIGWKTPFPDECVQWVRDKYGLEGEAARRRVGTLWGGRLSTRLGQGCECVADLVMELSGPIKNDAVSVLRVQCVDDPALEGVEPPSGGFCEARILYDPWPFFLTEDELKRKEIALEIVVMGLEALQRSRGIDLSAALSACRRAREMGLRCERLSRPKKSPSGRAAVVSIVRHTYAYVVRVAIYGKSGQMLYSDEVCRGGPSMWFAADECLGGSRWSGETFEMRSDWGFSFSRSFEGPGRDAAEGGGAE